MKSLLDRIEIRTPCNESWEAMTGNDEVRFCSHCARNVYDLSSMSRARAEKLVLDSRGNLCARYVKVERRSVVLYQAPTRITRRTAIAAGVLASSLAISSLASAQTPSGATDRVESSTTAASPLTSRIEDTIVVSGIVMDPHDAVIPGAVVMLRNYKAGRERSTVSAADGLFSFRDVEIGDYELEITSPYFTKLIVEGLKITGSIALTEKLIPAPFTETLLGVVGLIEEPVIPSTTDPSPPNVEARRPQPEPAAPAKKPAGKKKNKNNLPM